MGIWCEINLFENPDSSYKPGDKVHGMVKYVLDEETILSKVTLSLKGFGNLYISWTAEDDDTERELSYVDREDYVDIDAIIHTNPHNTRVAAGTYEAAFTFFLPENIPPSYDCFQFVHNYYTVQCKIKYYLRLKFETYGTFSFNKRFKTEINVCTIKPTMSTTPLTYEISKKPSCCFVSRNKIISMKGTLGNSVATPGGRVSINYQVENDTWIKLKGVRLELCESTTFYNQAEFDVNETKSLSTCTTESIGAGGSQTLELHMDIPADIATIQYSRLVSRSYYINIEAMFPFPRRNATLRLPLEVVKLDVGNSVPGQDPPPSYLHAMAEYEIGEFK